MNGGGPMSSLKALIVRFLPDGLGQFARLVSRRRRTTSLLLTLARETPGHRVRALDVGARGGIDAESIFRRVRDYPGLHLIGIEPDPAEAARLRSGADGPYAEVLPVAVGSATETRTLFLTRHPGCASLRSPLPEAVAPYISRDFFAVTGTSSVETTTLDRLFAGAEPFDLIKLDVQGVEDEVLEGGRTQSEARLESTWKPSSSLFMRGSLCFLICTSGCSGSDFGSSTWRDGTEFTMGKSSKRSAGISGHCRHRLPDPS